jgi:PAS domain S-box-containing protein
VGSSRQLSQAIVNYANRTSKNVVLADAANDEQFASDPYVAQHQPKSIACSPISRLGRLVGILYLENNLTTNAFTPDRIEVMQILSAQAAISLEDVRLYEEMKQEIAGRQRTEMELRSSEDQFHSLFENSIDAILLATPDGNVIAANSEACRVFGRTEEEICELGRTGLVDPAHPRLPVLLEERARTGRFKGELNFRRKDESIFPGEVSSAFYKDKSGATKASAIIRDITKRKLVEEALRKAHDELEARVEERTAELSEANKLLTIQSEERLRHERFRIQSLGGARRRKCHRTGAVCQAGYHSFGCVDARHRWF